MAVDVAKTKMPDPLREHPPASRYCDLVLNGGVASGVVYPWALLHLARHYRFKSIGGNSVGAMAATLAAAAEYGRCNGVEDAFEPLRWLPLKLADDTGGGTKMLRLFQPSRQVQRLFDVFIAAVKQENRPTPQRTKDGGSNHKPQSQPETDFTPAAPVGPGPLQLALRVYGFWQALLLASLMLGWGATVLLPGCQVLWLLLPVLASAFLAASVCVALRVCRDIRALADNGYGLCTGRGQTVGDEGLVEWLHKGIQLSAGRAREDPPLTFADLWSAPRFGRAGPPPLAGGLQPDDPGIELQMFASNVTQGRPLRLPIDDANTRLYFDPGEWEAYFPPGVLDALKRASTPYRPASPSDPDPASLDPAHPNAAQRALMARLLELPSGGMPIVVAARLSLCFPLLFSCVPVYAVDYEGRQQSRFLRKCLLSDGGLCTNFPIHLFDAAHPQWPTFAFLFSERLRDYEEQSVWLPQTHSSGRSDNWQRGVPGAEQELVPERTAARRLLGVAGGLLLTMKDWNDRVTSRLPQVRNRTIRLALRKGEGQLNLAMPSGTILQMAHEYGTSAGIELVNRFGPSTQHGIAQAWREHLYVRSMIELRALRGHLKGYARSVRSGGDSVPLRQLLDRAIDSPPLMGEPGLPADPTGNCLIRDQRDALVRALDAVEALEAELAVCEANIGPYRPLPQPELRMRPPI